MPVNGRDGVFAALGGSWVAFFICGIYYLIIGNVFNGIYEGILFKTNVYTD